MNNIASTFNSIRGGVREKSGRPPNAIRELCREHVFNDKLIEKLAEIAKGSIKDSDRIRAIEVLLDRGFGKPDQHLDITQQDENRPSTDALIETLRVLREELDSLRKGTSVEAK